MVGSLTLTLARVAPRAGLVGAAAIAGSASLTALFYRGTADETYSPLNHFVSELGELGVSSLAIVFNVGLIVGGVCFATFLVGLGESRGGVIGAVQAITGLLAGAAGTLVGVFPLGSHGPHTAVASAFFGVGSLAVALVAVDALLRPTRRFTGEVAWLGLLAVAVTIVFIGTYAARAGSGTGLAPGASRPGLDPVALLEWLALAGIVLWTAVTAMVWARQPTTEPR